MKKSARKGDPAKKYADLTPLQQQVVRFMVDNNKSQWDAVSEGLVSEASVNAWRSSAIMAWCEDYRTSRPASAEELAARARAQVNDLLASSLRVLQDTLVNGEGNQTAVRTAQWVLDGIFAQAKEAKTATPVPGMAPQNPEAELQAVLRLVKK